MYVLTHDTMSMKVILNLFVIFTIHSVLKSFGAGQLFNNDNVHRQCQYFVQEVTNSLNYITSHYPGLFAGSINDDLKCLLEVKKNVDKFTYFKNVIDLDVLQLKLIQKPLTNSPVMKLPWDLFTTTEPSPLNWEATANELNCRTRQNCETLADENIIKINTKLEEDETTKTVIDMVNQFDYTIAVMYYNQLGQEARRKIVTDLYDKNVNNVMNIIRFLDRLPQKSDTNYGLSILMNEMKQNNDLYSIPAMTLAYKAKLGNDDEKSDFMNITSHLPETINNFPFNESFKIFNKKFQEVYTSSNVFFGSDPNMRKAFTEKVRINIDVEHIDSENEDPVDWVLRTFNDGITFVIQNLGSPGYLYANYNETNVDVNKRRVFISVHRQTGDEWQFEPMEDGNFRIKNVYWDEYLYASDVLDSNQNLRQVVTWVPKGCDGDTCHWTYVK